MKTLRFPTQLNRIALLTISALIALLASTTAAQATIYCVQNPACPAGGVPKATFDAAIAAADTDAAKDTVRIGPGTFTSSQSAVQPIDIIGAGIGATEFTDANVGGTVLYAKGATSNVSDLTVRVTQNGQYGMRLQNAGSVQRVEVTGSHSLTAVSGFIIENPGSDLQSVSVDLGSGLSGSAIVDLGGATIEDATLTAGVALRPVGAGTIARRLRIRSTIAFSFLGGILNVANALVTPHPDDPNYSGFTAADVQPGNSGTNALLNAADLTVVGNGQGSGIIARYNVSAVSGTATANVSGAIIRGVDKSFVRTGKSAAQPANVTVKYSAFDGSTYLGTANGSYDTSVGNLMNDPDPKFIDPAGGDYRLRFDSPLLDKGPPTEPLSGDNPDLGGRSRVRDSDGNGSSVRDVGAHEYQRLAPSASFTLAPAATGVGTPVNVDAAASSDPDGDPISYGWNFGDGGTATGVNAAHPYGAGGLHDVTLTATDATGLAAGSTQAVTISANPGAGLGSSQQAPVLSKLSQSASSWVAGNTSASIARKRRKRVGTTFSFALNTAANVRLTFSQTAKGRKVSGRCVRSTASNAKRPRCKRSLTAGSISLKAHAGTDKVRFAGRLASKKLKPGSYKMTAIATDASGRQSAPQSLVFKVLRAG